MRTRERIPLHNHSDINSGGLVAASTIVQLSGVSSEGSGASASSLVALSDVSATSAAEDDTLRYVGGVWINDNRRWEAVTAGEDVLVWDGSDLVHDWSAY